MLARVKRYSKVHKGTLRFDGLNIFVDVGGIHQKQRIITIIVRMQELLVPIDPWPANPHLTMVA